jgi:hypothetical protein
VSEISSRIAHLDSISRLLTESATKRHVLMKQIENS